MRTLAAPLLIVALMTACGTLQPGADPFIVRAEQTQQVAFDTFDTFVTMDNNNRTLFRTSFPEAHAVAEWLRAPVTRIDGKTMQRGLSILEDLKAAKALYKAVPNTANKTALAVQLAKTENTLSTVQQQLAAVKEH